MIHQMTIAGLFPSESKILYIKKVYQINVNKEVLYFTGCIMGIGTPSPELTM